MLASSIVMCLLLMVLITFLNAHMLILLSLAMQLPTTHLDANNWTTIQ